MQDLTGSLIRLEGVLLHWCSVYDSRFWMLNVQLYIYVCRTDRNGLFLHAHKQKDLHLCLIFIYIYMSGWMSLHRPLVFSAWERQIVCRNPECRCGIRFFLPDLHRAFRPYRIPSACTNARCSSRIVSAWIGRTVLQTKTHTHCFHRFAQSSCN